VFHTDADKLLFLLETEAELSAFLADDALQAEAGEERPRYITNYIGSKQKLTDWIWKSTPDDVQTAVDAFSGSSVVAYMFKTHGLGVHAVDRLAYCHAIARAIIENDSATLSDEEIQKLHAPNAKAKDFVRKHFKGVYFQAGVHAVIDTIRSNIDATGIEGFKRDIALFALGKACITGKGGVGHFGTTKQQEGRADNPEQFKERFAANCRRISALVFKGERPCKAHHGDTRKILPGLKADAAYFDPPYATQFSQTNYERAYHFVEGLMTWREGKEIQAGSQTRQYEIPTEVTGDETKKKTQGQDEAPDPAELSDAEKVKRIKKQQADIERLTKENESLKQKLDEAEAARKAMVRKARAEKLLAAWQEAGREFGDEAGRTAELERLMKLSDQGFDATEAAVQAFAAGKKKKPDDEEDPADGDDEEEDGKKPLPFGPKEKRPKKQAGMNADAGRSGGMPSPSPDRKGSLAEKLTAGFMAAWKDRAGNDA